MSATLVIETFDSSKFHVRGTNWTYRLRSAFSEVPKGDLLFDALVKDDEDEIGIQLFCCRDEKGLAFSGDWQAPPPQEKLR